MNSTDHELEEPPRLSFCDLPRYESSASGDSDVATSAPQESFIFDFFTSGDFAPPESIVFCGRQLVNNGQGKPARGLKKRVFHWTKRVFGGSSPGQPKKKTTTFYYDRVWSKSSSRRWLALMFGSVRVPSGMDLADIKTRQKRRAVEPKAFVAMFDDHEQQERNKLEPEMGARSCFIGGLVRSFSSKA